MDLAIPRGLRTLLEVEITFLARTHGSVTARRTRVRGRCAAEQRRANVLTRRVTVSVGGSAHGRQGDGRAREMPPASPRTKSWRCGRLDWVGQTLTRRRYGPAA